MLCASLDGPGSKMMEVYTWRNDGIPAPWNRAGSTERAGLRRPGSWPVSLALAFLRHTGLSF
jgi:hypothetical protein